MGRGREGAPKGEREEGRFCCQAPPTNLDTRCAKGKLLGAESTEARGTAEKCQHSLTCKSKRCCGTALRASTLEETRSWLTLPPFHRTLSFALTYSRPLSVPPTEIAALPKQEGAQAPRRPPPAACAARGRGCCRH